MNVMVFAAGFGTRMRPLTDTTAKALVPVAGRALLDHALEQARAAEPEAIVVNGHHFAHDIAAHLADTLNVTFVHEHPQVLETGGGLKNALPLLGTSPVMTLNSDAVWTGTSAAQSLLHAWDPVRMDGLLLVVPVTRAHGRKGAGDFGLRTGGVLTRDGEDLIYTGAGIVKTTALAAIEEDAFSLWELWTPMIAANRLHGVIHPGHWADVGYPGGISIAERMMDVFK